MQYVVSRLAGLAFILMGLVGSVTTAYTESQEAYLLGPNDVVRVQVFGEEDLSVESTVDGDGKITFPLLGALSVKGRTVQNLQDELTARLREGYIRDPKVTVFIVRHRNFFVSGEVRKPGGFEYKEGMTVEKALALAEGLTDKADRSEVKVTRQTEGSTQTLPVELDALVLPNDLIIVPQAPKFYVNGEVKRPGGFEYKEGMTVQKALALAEGFTEKADRSEVKVTRHNKGRMQTVPIALDAPVLPNDLIVVSQAPKFYVNGEVRRAGDYLYEKGLTVHRAITMAGGFTEKASESRTKVLRVINGQEETISVKLDDLIRPNDIIVVPQRFF